MTGTVTVNNPDTGNKVMTSTLTTAAPGSNCPSGGTDPRCTATVNVLIPGLTIVKTANVSTTTPGSVVGYTVTVTDTGQTPYTGATFSDNLSGLLPRRRLQRRRRGDDRVGVLRGPGPDLDGEPRGGGERHDHLLGHRE